MSESTVTIGNLRSLRPGRWAGGKEAAARWLIAGLSLVAIGWCVYLTLVSIGFVELGACSSGSCSAIVMKSAWSRYWGVPVSAAAIPLYLAILWGVWLTGSPQSSRRRAGWMMAIAACLMAAGGSLWFLYLLIFDMHKSCGHCVLAHVFNFSLAYAVMMFAPIRTGQRARAQGEQCVGALSGSMMILLVLTAGAADFGWGLAHVAWAKRGQDSHGDDVLATAAEAGGQAGLTPANAIPTEIEDEASCDLGAKLKAEGFEPSVASAFWYRVIQPTNGRQPGFNDTVTVWYRRLNADKTLPAAEVAERNTVLTWQVSNLDSQVLQEVLLAMHEGERWELVHQAGAMDAAAKHQSDSAASDGLWGRCELELVRIH